MQPGRGVNENTCVRSSDEEEYTTTAAQLKHEDTFNSLCVSISRINAADQHVGKSFSLFFCFYNNVDVTSISRPASLTFLTSSSYYEMSTYLYLYEFIVPWSLCPVHYLKPNQFWVGYLKLIYSNRVCSCAHLLPRICF